MHPDPMLRVLEAKCSRCQRVFKRGLAGPDPERPKFKDFPVEVAVSDIRNVEHRCIFCWRAGEEGQVLLVTEPV